MYGILEQDPDEVDVSQMIISRGLINLVEEANRDSCELLVQNSATDQDLATKIMSRLSFDTSKNTDLISTRMTISSHNISE